MKKGLQVVLLLAIYFLLMFFPMFMGFASATLWFFYPVVAALLAATPLMWWASKQQKLGAVAIFPLVWYLLMLLMGELAFPERMVAPVVIIVLAEIMRRVIGYGEQKALRLSYAASSLVTAMQHLIIFTRTDYYYEGAVEEMGSVEYAEKIVGYAKPGYLILLLVFTFGAGYLGALISEKIFKNKVIVGEE